MSAEDWNHAALERLRALWAEGHSTAEIGRRMGMSKNAIVGKAHRLDLPGRPSPIRGNGTTAPPTPSKTMRREAAVAALKLTKIPQREAAVPTTPKSRPSDRRAVAEVRAKPGIGRPEAVAKIAAGESPAPISAPPAAPLPVVFKPRPPGGCCWPMWGNRQRPTFVYCHATRPAGRIYCDVHARIAYSKTTGALPAPASSVPNSNAAVCTSVAPSRSLSGTIRSDSACDQQSRGVRCAP